MYEEVRVGVGVRVRVGAMECQLYPARLALPKLSLLNSTYLLTYLLRHHFIVRKIKTAEVHSRRRTRTLSSYF